MNQVKVLKREEIKARALKRLEPQKTVLDISKIRNTWLNDLNEKKQKIRLSDAAMFGLKLNL